MVFHLNPVTSCKAMHPPRGVKKKKKDLERQRQTLKFCLSILSALDHGICLWPQTSSLNFSDWQLKVPGISCLD